MLTGIVLLYFSLACLALAWWLFPAMRVPLLARVRAWRRPSLPGGMPRLTWVMALVILLLSIPPLSAWWWGTRTPSARSLEAFDEAPARQPSLVGNLLAGEQLVPPEPLPPDVFTTAEVEIVRPMLALADRRWEQMDPAFVQRLLSVFKVMKDEHGYDMALLEGYRSPERQARLAQMGAHVTNAGAWQSYHQFGVAADCAFYRDGKLVISEKDPWAMRGYQLYGEVAERMGLVWGGRWKMMDFGHVEWRRPGLKLGNTR